MDSDRGKLLSLSEVIALVLMALPLLVTASLIEDARWVRGLPPLKPLVPISLVVWAYLARGRIPGLIAHPVAVLAGLLVAFLIGAFTLSGGNGFGDLANNLGSWFGAIGSEEGDRGASMVGVAMIALTLLMGHFTAWLAYRRTTSVFAALPGLAVLMVVLTFLHSDFYWYFFMYLLAAAPGVAYRYAGRWSIRWRRTPLLGSVVAGVVLMGLTLAPVTQVPTPEGTVIPLASQFEEPWYSFREQWSNLFYGVPNRKQWPAFSPPRDLPIIGPFTPDGTDLFVVESEEPHRWRMRVYETYTGGGWVSDEQPTTEAGSAVPLHEFAETLKERENVEIDVRIYAKSNSLISVGEPLKASIPAKVEFSPKPTFKLYLGDSQTSYLPRVVEENRKDLVSWARWAKAAESAEKSAGDGGDQGVVPQSSIRLDPNTLGFRLAAPEEGSSAFKSVQRSVPYVFMERMEPGPNPPVALLGDRVLVPPRQYKSIGSISTATGPMLRAAAGAYPQWVTDRYLQLPNDFPESVKELARELTSGDDNSYDMSQSVRRYLLTLPYSLDVSIPPEGQDWVEFFLFVQRRGYCQNYATSMITMLRSLGVPARLVVGFAPQLDEDRGLWVAQAQQYHAWPEVYFPEYGWVEFEPTPARVQPGLVLLDQPAGGPIISATAGFDCPPEEEFLGICDDENPFDPSIIGVEEDFTGIGEDVPGPEPSSGFGFGGFLSSTWTLVALGVLLAVVVPGGTLSYMGRRFARLGYPTVAFASMCLMGRLAGVAHGPRETPSEYGCRLARSFPDHGEAIARITQGFVTVRYGPSKEADPLERTGIRSAWRSLRGALRTRALRRLVPLQRRPSTSSG